MPRLKELQCFDFRNYEERVFRFTEDLVIFWGDNGKGKTNLLEALSVLSTGKSWREGHASNLIRNDQTSAKITCTFEQQHYESLITPRTRQFFRNEKKTGLTKHIGQIPTLLFCPEHLHLFIGSKAERLKFFDRFLVQTQPGFREALIRASRAHKQKNAVLKSGDSPEATKACLAPWNTILSETLPQVFETRTAFLHQINPSLQKNFSEISQNQHPISAEFTLDKDVTLSPDAILDFFALALPREIASKRNSLSPNSGDIHFALREQKLTHTASRGETRSALLALLSAKKEYLHQVNQASPILLLDDVFSELDDHRQKHLEQLCENTQAFFTTTHQEHFKNFSQKAQGIEIK